MKALNIFASPEVRRSIRNDGLKPQDIAFVSATATGLQGLVLGSLDRFLFGDWLVQSTRTVELIGSSFGSLRMAAVACSDPVAKLQQLEDEFIADVLEPGHGAWDAHSVAAQFSDCIARFYQSEASSIVSHSKYRLHVICSRGRGILNTDQTFRHVLGYSLAFAANALSRKALGHFHERAVFSGGLPLSEQINTGLEPTPFAMQDLRTHWMRLTEKNLTQALLASCSIPFALPPVLQIPDAIPGAYWDGGVTDYDHCLQWNTQVKGYILMLNLSGTLIPGWLDAPLWWRHQPVEMQQRLIVLSPTPQWIASLPRGKLPDRTDFRFHGKNKSARIAQWRHCMRASEQLAHDLHHWLRHQDPATME